MENKNNANKNTTANQGQKEGTMTKQKTIARNFNNLKDWTKTEIIATLDEHINRYGSLSEAAYVLSNYVDISPRRLETIYNGSM